jgi:hypothetical protein
MDVREIKCNIMDWIELAQNIDQYGAFEHTVMNIMIE